MIEQSLNQMLATTIQEVKSRAQLHHESLAFVDAQERLNFLQQQCTILLTTIHLLAGWQDFAQSLREINLLQGYGSSVRTVLRQELTDLFRSPGAAIVAGNIAYIQLIAQISGVNALMRERKLIVVYQVVQHLAGMLAGEDDLSENGTIAKTLETFSTLIQSETSDVFALCSSTLLRYQQLLRNGDTVGSNYEQHEG